MKVCQIIAESTCMISIRKYTTMLSLSKGTQVLKKRVFLLLVTKRRVRYIEWLNTKILYIRCASLCALEIKPAFVRRSELGVSVQSKVLAMFSKSRTPCILYLKGTQTKYVLHIKFVSIRVFHIHLDTLTLQI